MANPEHVEVVKQGAAAIVAWREKNRNAQLELRGASLREADLTKCDLFNADLSGADLTGANLSLANLSFADLTEADLSDVNRGVADLSRAKLDNVDSDAGALRRADLENLDPLLAILSGANPGQASLSFANLFNAILREADLSRAALYGANLYRADLSGANLHGAQVGQTSFTATNLVETKGLEDVEHLLPSAVGLDTLFMSEGKIPEAFLRGCGMHPWEVVAARIYDPHLTALEIADIQAEIFRLRTEGPIFIGGVFISYAREDSEFVDKIFGKLQDEGVSAWLDTHDVVAGPIDRQIIDAIRLNDIVLVVLSKNSVDSRWVQHEIRTACEREEKENRTILCPIALDDSWKAKEGVDWSQLWQKAVLDFSAPDGFDSEFKKLLDGMKKYYPKK